MAIKILIADDHALLRQGIKRVLNFEDGFEVIGEAEDGQEAVARTLMLQPDVLLRDEPFSALDAITREEMQEVFFELWRAQAVTTVIVTHYVEEALYLGQTLVVLSSVPGHVLSVMNNPHFAKRESSGDFVAQKARLRGWLTGKKGAGA